MTEPQTPTGRDFLAEMFTDDADREVAARVVCAIEREAAAAERERVHEWSIRDTVGRGEDAAIRAGDLWDFLWATDD